MRAAQLAAREHASSVARPLLFKGKLELGDNRFKG